MVVGVDGSEAPVQAWSHASDTALDKLDRLLADADDMSGVTIERHVESG